MPANYLIWLTALMCVGGSAQVAGLALKPSYRRLGIMAVGTALVALALVLLTFPTPDGFVLVPSLASVPIAILFAWPFITSTVLFILFKRQEDRPINAHIILVAATSVASVVWLHWWSSGVQL